MSDRPNIHRSVAAICRRLGLKPNDVARLNITPGAVTAEIYKLNENGSKYVDQETGKVAKQRRSFKVYA